MKDKQYIAGLYPQEVKNIIADLKQPAYRAKQILDWVFKKGVLSWSEMKNLSVELRSSLLELLEAVSLKQAEKLVSSADKTAKYIFLTVDGHAVETVFIPTAKRATVCISTQVGCAFGCTFCASGMGGLVRDLSSDEIVSQVLLVKRDNKDRQITNIVFMGMGEPFANYENTLKAVRILNDPDCLGLAARKITISTCGLPEKIMRFSKEKLQVELSVSLHAADNDLRDKIMPINKKYPIEVLMKTAAEYTQITNRVITFEYVIIADLNDSTQDAEHLADLLYRLKAKLNLIPYNPVHDLDAKYAGVNRPQFEVFKETLVNRKINFTVRRSRGSDVNGACGQLRAQYKT